MIDNKKQTKETRQRKTSSPAYDTGLCTLQEPCPSRKSFLIVAFATLFLLMGSTIPTPLYGIYRIDFALSHVSITLIYAMYALPIVPALFFFGPLGDMLGRKRLLIIAIAFACIGTVILALATGLEWLLLGRLAQGIAVAAALGNATAALVELEPTGDKQRASQVAGIAAISGLGLGPLVASLMAEYLVYPTFLVYIVELALLIIVLIFIFTIKDAGSYSRRFRFHRPAFPPAKWSFISASLASTLTFATSGLYFSLAPIYAQAILQTNNIILGGSITSIMIFTSVAAQFILWNRSQIHLEIGGLLSLMVGLSMIILADTYSSLVILLIASIITGIGFGSALIGAVNVINRIAPADRRGDVTSSFYAISYLALGVPVIGLGFAAQYINLFVAVQVFIAVIVITAIINIPLIFYSAKT